MDRQSTLDRMGTDFRSAALDVRGFSDEIAYLSAEMSFEASLQNARKIKNASITYTDCSSCSSSS
jgi:hypothetical protein